MKHSACPTPISGKPWNVLSQIPRPCALHWMWCCNWCQRCGRTHLWQSCRCKNQTGSHQAQTGVVWFAGERLFRLEGSATGLSPNWRTAHHSWGISLLILWTHQRQSRLNQRASLFCSWRFTNTYIMGKGCSSATPPQANDPIFQSQTHDHCTQGQCSHPVLPFAPETAWKSGCKFRFVKNWSTPGVWWLSATKWHIHVAPYEHSHLVSLVKHPAKAETEFAILAKAVEQYTQKADKAIDTLSTIALQVINTPEPP